MSTFLISSGGTGGHLAPGIALAEQLIARGHTCRLIVSSKKVDSRLIAKYPHLDFVSAPGVGFQWGVLKTPRFVLGQLHSILFSLKLLRRLKPAAVVGFGGFTTVGLSLAARFLRVPVFLHEANRVPGRAIRSLSGLARCVYVPPGVSLRGLPPKRLRECGFPLRKEMRRMPKQQARERLGIRADGKLLLVLGGSQGAASFNDWVASNFIRLAQDGISVYCVTGLNKGEQGIIVKRGGDGVARRAYFSNFCDDMPALLSAADLVLSRAGAGSIAEFMRFRLPVILVPYPHAADNHQEANADFAERQGAAVRVNARQMDRLFKEILDLVFNDWMLGKLRENMERLDRDDPAAQIADDLEKIATNKNADF